MQYCFYLGWRGLTSTEWAAWVQAVGSVLAIIAAIALAWWQDHRATRQREAMALEQRELQESQARSLVLTIHGDLIALVSQLESIVRALDTHEHAPLLELSRKIKTEALDDIRASSWQFGQLGKPLQLLISALDTIEVARNDLQHPKGSATLQLSERMLRKTIQHAAEVGRETLGAISALIARAADYPWTAKKN